MTTRRRQVGLLLLVAALVVSSFILGRQFAKPAWQDVSKQAAPVGVWVPAEQRVVSDDVQISGSIVPPTTSPLLPAKLPDSPIMTVAAPQKDAKIGPGSFVGEISGKPYFILAPPLSLYRDLREGDEGADVRTLQQSLTASGYEVPATGHVGTITLDAVARLFATAEHSLPTETVPDQPAATQSPTDGPSAAAAPKPPRKRRYIPHAQLVASKGGVITSGLRVGDRPGGETPLLRIETAPRSIRALVSADLVSRFAVGTHVVGTLADGTVQGVVKEVGAFQQDNDGSKAGHPLVIIPDGDALDALPDGQAIVLTTGKDQPAPTAAVPLTALRTSGNDTTVITRQGEVTVTVLRSADGWAAVEGIDTGTEVKVS